MDLKKLFALAIVLSMMITVMPVFAWTYPDESEDDLYEKFGPRLDKVYIRMFATESDEWDAALAGEIDMTDWPLSAAYYDQFIANPETGVSDYGAELGYYLVDINNDNGPLKEVGYPNPLYKTNPCGFVQEGDEPYKDSAAEFRKAIWRCLDRDYLVDNVWMGFAVPMTTPIPTAMGEYMHPDAYVPVEEGGLSWGFDLDNASAILDAAGFVDTDADGWRNFPVSLGGDGANIELIYYTREDHKERKEMGIKHAEWIESIGVKVDLRIRDRSTCNNEVMVYKNFHLYTGGWSIGREPDVLVLYQIKYYWHPGFCYNYGRINDTIWEGLVDDLMEANTYEEALEKTHLAQEAFNLGCFGACFAVCTAGKKAWYKTYTGGTGGVPTGDDEDDYRGNDWLGLVSVGSYGLDSYWTFLAAHPEGYEYGNCEDMTMRWGFKTSTMERPSNPAYAEWVWDWNVLGLTYDSLLVRDAYTYEFIPWLCKKFEAFTWVDPSDGLTKSGVKFVLRDDVFWSDGTPLTAADVEYSLIELDDELINLGYGAPWWYSNTVYIKSFYMTDPYNIEILLDIKSFFAVGWIGGSIVLPKHIWKAMIEADKAEDPDPYDFWGPYVDPNVIGTGPYRFVEYAEGDHTLLVANKPAMAPLTTAWDGAEAITSPGYFRYLPAEFGVYIKEPEELAYRAKIPYEEPITMTYDVSNLWAEDSISMGSTIEILNGTTRELIWDATDTQVIPPQTDQWPWWDIHVIHTCIDYDWSYCHIEEKGWPLDYICCHKYIWMHINGYLAITLLGDPIFEAYWDSIPVYIHIKTCFYIPHLYENPPACTYFHFDYSLSWSVIKQDIAGSTWYDQARYVDMTTGETIYPFTDYPYSKQVPTPDGKVDMKDIGRAAKAFGSYPGHARWDSVSDINDDYKVDMKDIGGVARFFGWKC
jgi:ABC-type transport system substrate-binding protein